MAEKIEVWEISPHPGDSRYDCLWEKDGYTALDYLVEHIDFVMCRYTPEQLRSGVTITIKLVEIDADESLPI